MTHPHADRTTDASDYGEPAQDHTREVKSLIRFCQVYGCGELCTTGLCDHHTVQQAAGTALEMTGPLPGQFADVEPDEWINQDGTKMNGYQVRHAKKRRAQKQFERGTQG